MKIESRGQSDFLPCHQHGRYSLEGNKALGKQIGLQRCKRQLSFLPEAEEQHFSLLSLCAEEGEGRRAALGRPP